MRRTGSRTSGGTNARFGSNVVILAGGLGQLNGSCVVAVVVVVEVVVDVPGLSQFSNGLRKFKFQGA